MSQAETMRRLDQLLAEQVQQNQTAPAPASPPWGQAGRVAGGRRRSSPSPAPAHRRDARPVEDVDSTLFGRVLKAPPEPPQGLDCACDGRGGVCLAHWATAGQERPGVRGVPWLPADA